MQLTLISSHVFPSKKRNRITDWYCSHRSILVANKHELNDLQQLSKQNYSINLFAILTVIVKKMVLNNGIHILRQWCHQSINTGTYQTAHVIHSFCYLIVRVTRIKLHIISIHICAHKNVLIKDFPRGGVILNSPLFRWMSLLKLFWHLTISNYANNKNKAIHASTTYSNYENAL